MCPTTQKQHPTAADSLRMNISQIAVTWQVQSRSPTVGTPEIDTTVVPETPMVCTGRKLTGTRGPQSTHPQQLSQRPVPRERRSKISPECVCAANTTVTKIVHAQLCADQGRQGPEIYCLFAPEW